MTIEKLLLKIRERIATLSHNASQMCEEYEGYRLACMDVSDLLDEIAKELSQPSLPSDIDEAAEAHRRKVFCGDPDYSQLLRDTFKAGAEWMAGQGVSYDCECIEALQRAVGDKMNAQFSFKYTGLKGGDKVVVQIRKK